MCWAAEVKVVRLLMVNEFYSCNPWWDFATHFGQFPLFSYGLGQQETDITHHRREWTMPQEILNIIMRCYEKQNLVHGWQINTAHESYLKIITKNHYSHVPKERPRTFIRHLKKFSYFFPYFYQKFHRTLIPTHTFPKLLASFSWGSLFTLWNSMTVL